MVGPSRDRVGTEGACRPVERLRDPAQAPVVLMPLAVEVPADHNGPDRAGAGGLQSGRGALGAGPGCPRVVDEEHGAAVEGMVARTSLVA